MKRKWRKKTKSLVIRLYIYSYLLEMPKHTYFQGRQNTTMAKSKWKKSLIFFCKRKPAKAKQNYYAAFSIK